MAVFGCGGIGLNAIQGAKMAAAGRIIGVDVDAGKEAKARELGATDFVDSSKVDPVAALKGLTGGMG